jgi:integrase|tara:strand:- start:203 stop:1357 length:1155 start_codon:yes stop_codon:yes gene_type:complete
MAGLRKLKGNYYARVWIPRDSMRPREILVSLRTKMRSQAGKRLREVSKDESEFMERYLSGERLRFWWETETQKTEVQRYNLTEAVDNYLRSREADRLRKSTLDIYKLALNGFQKAVNPSLVVRSIRASHIEKFKRHLQQSVSVVTANMRLRAVKTFLRWLEERGKIDSVPPIRQLNTGKPLPIYLSNADFAEVLKAVSKITFKDKRDKSHYQKAFHFYRETGCRLSEPFNAVLQGNWLIIEAESAKTHQTREVFLTPELLSIVNEMRNRFEQFNGKSRNDFIKRYSKVFKKACRIASVEGKKFHSLRHTFAVRRYLETRDIYQVAKELGHSSVTTTENYAQFSFRRLQQDFPDLAKSYRKTSENAKTDIISSDINGRELVISRR